MLDWKKLDEFYIDAFRELGNIGAGHAGSSLSELTGKDIKIAVPQVKILEIGDVGEEVGEDVIVAGSVTLVKDDIGEINGYLYTFFPEEGALRIIDILMGMDMGTTEEIDEMGRSAISEVSNILASSFCDACADFLDIVLLPDPPSFCNDMSSALIDPILASVAEDEEVVVAFVTRFESEEFGFDCYLVFFPKSGGLEKLLGLLEEMYR